MWSKHCSKTFLRVWIPSLIHLSNVSFEHCIVGFLEVSTSSFSPCFRRKFRENSWKSCSNCSVRATSLFLDSERLLRTTHTDTVILIGVIDVFANFREILGIVANKYSDSIFVYSSTPLNKIYSKNTSTDIILTTYLCQLQHKKRIENSQF